MAIPHFFSIERKGYLRISDLFCDVLKDMTANGFSAINISHGTSAVDLKSWKTTVQSNAVPNNIFPGTKLYIVDGNRPISPKGVVRPVPWVVVNSVIPSNSTVATADVGIGGNVAITSDVRAEYDLPFWTTPPTGAVELYLDQEGKTKANVLVELDQVTIQRSSAAPGQEGGVITSAPDSFSFTVEASGDVDPLNGTTDPNAPTSLRKTQDAVIQIKVVDATASYESIGVGTAGQQYAPGDQFTVSGADLGGASPTNDATVTVTNVDGNGGITGFAVVGSAQTSGADRQYTNIALPDTDKFDSPVLQLFNKQPWRVQFVITDEQKVNGSVATHLQMYYDEEAGRVAISKITDDDGDIVDNVGSMGAIQPRGIFSDDDINQGFYNRKTRVADQPQTFPLSYLLTITDRGFFLGIWEGNWSTIRGGNSSKSNYFNWVLVQRPVDRITGITLTSGKAPVFHINSVNYKYYKSVVRESDVLHPTNGVSPLVPKGLIRLKGLFSTKPDDWWIQSIADPVSSTADEFGDVTVWKDGTYIYDNFGIPISKLKARFGNGAMFGNTGSTLKDPFNNSISDQFEHRANLATRPVPPFGYPTNLKRTNVSWKDFYESSDTTPNVAVTQSMVSVAGTTAAGWLTKSISFGYTEPGTLAYRVLADEHSPDSHMIFNGVEQVALTEDKTYLLSFPHNLTTPRFRYTEELDMIGYTSADVVMAGQEIQFQTYGEDGPRTYMAMPASSPLNTGFRIAVLVAPQGPVWQTAAGSLGSFSPGDQVAINLNATKVADGNVRGRVTFKLVRGQLPTGITIVDTGTQYQLIGTLETMDFNQATDIKFTLGAFNSEDDGDGGRSYRDFWITYTPA